MVKMKYYDALVILVIVVIALACAPDTKAQTTCSIFYITGYASSQFPGTTRDGTRTIGNEWTIVAVDPRVIPLQSEVWIEGLGTFRAADTGGGVLGNHIDVLVYTPAEAYSLTGKRLACIVGV